jgi:hypothetical protein
MRRFGVWKGILALGSVVVGLAAAPAAPSYHAVERTIQEIRAGWSKPGAPAQPNAPGWNALFDALQSEFRTYASAADENARLASLNRIYQVSVALSRSTWQPAVSLREELRTWLRPRVRLAWAERRLVERVRSLQDTNDANVRANRDRWVRFVGEQLGSALRVYDAAATVAQRQEALKQVYGALNALQEKNQGRAWNPSVELQAALDDLYNIPNLDVSADLESVRPALSTQVVQSGPVERKGYISQVTAGPYTGFGLLPSDEGILFYNKQLMTSVTPIHDFQQQMARDRQGRRAAKMYHFDATTVDQAELTILTILTPSGLRVTPQYAHNINALISSVKQPGGALGRFIAAVVGYNQQRITDKVYEEALPRMQQDVVKESAEMGQEKANEAAAQRNAQLSRYLIGNDALAFRNLLIKGLSLRSRPENVLLGGTLQWLNAADQVGADAPQPASFAVPSSGVSADLHLSSIMTSLCRGYLQSPKAQSVQNLVIVTRKIPPGAPPTEGVELKENLSYPDYLKAVAEAQSQNDPKVLAIRIKRPGRSPEFAADADGHLVALVHDLLIEVPAPPQAARGGLSGPPARVYRLSAPNAEIDISFKITAQTNTEPVRLSGRVEDFDPGPGARVFAVNEDEDKPQPLTAFTSSFVLGIFRTRVKGQPVNLPLSNLKLQGFAIREVSPLDPSGWIRVNLVRTSVSPAAGVH